MSVFAITTVKDELDILPFTLAHMLDEVDAVLIADNLSTDGTREMLADLEASEPYKGRLLVHDEPEVGYFQSARMTRLAAEAARQGAAWVVPFDADEWWYSPFGPLRDVLVDQPAAVSAAVLHDRVATGVDPAIDNPVERTGWRRREPAPLPKVAARAAVPVCIEQGNHGAHYETTTEVGRLVVFHYPYRSVEQFIRKVRNGAAAYAATDLPEEAGAHWRGYGRLSDEQLGDVFRKFFWTADPTADPTLIFDPVSA